ncbi:unnamed protein product, partial [Ectocarpus fasciculatus]
VGWCTKKHSRACPMQAPFDPEGNGAPSNDMAVLQESPAAPGKHAQDGSGGPLEATFEERFEQFYLQLAEGKTGGMVACVDEMQRIVDSTRQRQ